MNEIKEATNIFILKQIISELVKKSLKTGEKLDTQIYETKNTGISCYN